MNEYKCEKCGNDTRFYNEVTVEAKEVFNQKTGKIYLRDKSNSIDNVFQPVYCYKCGYCVEEYKEV